MRIEERTRIENDEGFGKKKLTLTVDGNVVKRAKALGFNLSDFTESILDVYAFAPEKSAKKELHQKYKDLFASMQRLLDEYGTSVEVASWIYTGDEGYEGEVRVELRPDGRLLQYDSGDLDVDGNEVPKTVDISEVTFNSTKSILENFIRAVTEAKEKRVEQIGELDMARRMVEAIWKPTEAPSGRDQGAERKEK